MNITPEELEKEVDRRIKEANLDPNSLIAREAIRENIFLENALMTQNNFSNGNELVEVSEQEFIQYFLPTVIRPSLADKKSLLAKRVGSMQSEFRVISNEDRSLLFICPPLMNTLNVDSSITWNGTEIPTNNLLTSMVERSKEMVDTVVQANNANDLVKSVSELLKFNNDDEWTKRWLAIFERYSAVVVDIIRVHKNEFTDVVTDTLKPADNATMSLDDFE